MPVHRRFAREIFESIESELRTKLFGSIDFLNRLDADDDWSFVIKIQALVEAAVTEAVVAKVGDSKVQTIVERLPLADEQMGKIALAKDLGLLTKEQRRFVRKMAELRNRLAHRVDCLKFKFPTFIAGMTASQRREWSESIAWFAVGKDDPQFWLKGAQEKPRLVLYVSVFMLLASLHVAKVEAETPRKIDAAALRTAEELFSSLSHDAADG